MSIQDPDKPACRSDHADTILPPRLQSGDTAAVAAPAGTFDRQAMQSGVRMLEAVGLKVMVPEEVFFSSGRFAGRDQQRAELFMRLVADPQIKAIFCIRGGYGSMRILPLLDYGTLRRCPKAIVGFSDITALLAAIYQCCNLITYHGPLVTTLAQSESAIQEALFQALFTPVPALLRAETGGEIKAGRATGKLLAGNLTTLNHLLGTPYQPQFEGRILLLEDTGEAPYRIDRMLMQMKLAGCLDKLAGLGLGTFESCGDEHRLFEIVDNLFGDEHFPILARLPFGHGKDNMTVPIGQTATLDTGGRTLSFEAAPTNDARD